MAVVSQEPALFSGSIAANIRYGLGPPGDGAAAGVEAAARLANAHGFIAGLGAGYETEVGEKGLRLSGGQRQRLAIARCRPAAPAPPPSPAPAAPPANGPRVNERVRGGEFGRGGAGRDEVRRGF